MKDRLKSMLFGAAGVPGGIPSHGARYPAPDERRSVHAEPLARHSAGLEQFFQALRGRDNLSILDLAGGNQANISFITGLGHRLYSEDFIGALDACFGGNPDSHSDPKLVQDFFSETLALTPASFDGALVWDSLQYLGPGLLEATVDHLHRLLRRDAYILAFFHSDEKSHQVPVYSYRITAEKSLQLVPRGTRRCGQFFNNRSLERLFQDFQTTKFFLSRDALREVLVKR